MVEKNIRHEYEKYKNDTLAVPKCLNLEISPCHGCPRENSSKETCVDSCERLRAFQYNKPFQHLPYYQEPSKLPQSVNVLEETPKTSKSATPETTSWKKVFPKKKPKDTVPPPMTDEEKLKIIRETTVCLKCGRNKSQYPLRRGLCISCCSGAWRQNRILHPLLGPWQRMSKKAINETRAYEKCLIEGCDIPGNRRELCRPHYLSWRRGKLVHPKFGKWLLKGEEVEKPMDTFRDEGIKEIAGEITPAMMDRAVNDVLGEVSQKNVVVLDFLKYPELYEAIKNTAKLQYLPVKHVLINLIAAGIVFGEKKR